jgi:hypothetical protein
MGLMYSTPLSRKIALPIHDRLNDAIDGLPPMFDVAQGPADRIFS